MSAPSKALLSRQIIHARTWLSRYHSQYQGRLANRHTAWPLSFTRSSSSPASHTKGESCTRQFDLGAPVGLVELRAEELHADDALAQLGHLALRRGGEWEDPNRKNDERHISSVCVKSAGTSTRPHARGAFLGVKAIPEFWVRRALELAPAAVVRTSHHHRGRARRAEGREAHAKARDRQGARKIAEGRSD